jgi:hypothetical protein
MKLLATILFTIITFCSFGQITKTDGVRIFLDVTDTTHPVLKYYNPLTGNVVVGSGEGGGDFQLGIDTPFLKSINNVLSINTRGLNNYAGTINVRDYGAKGDGVTDDYLYIQSAFNAAKDGATVIFPSGYTFYTSGGLNVNKRVSIIATGAVIRLKNSSTVKGMLSLNAKGSTVTGGQWDYNKANGNIGDITTEDPYNAFVILLNADSCTVQDASFVNVWGMAVKGEKSYCIIRNCDISSDIYGVYVESVLNNGTGNKALNNKVNQRLGGKYAQGIVFTSAPPFEQVDYEISGNYLKGPKDTTGFGPVIDQAIALAARARNGRFSKNVVNGYVMGISEGGPNTTYSDNTIDSLIGISYGIEPSGGNISITGNIISHVKRGISCNSAINSYDNSTIQGNNISAEVGVELQIAAGQTGRNISITGGLINATFAGITATRDTKGLYISTTIVGPGSNVSNSRGLYLNTPPDSAYVTITGSKFQGFERWGSVYAGTNKTINFLTSINNDFSKDVASSDGGWFAEGLASIGHHVSSTGNVTSIGNKKNIYDQQNNIIVMYDDSYSTPEGNIQAGVGSMYYSLLNGGNIYRKAIGNGYTGWSSTVTAALSVPLGASDYIQKVDSSGQRLLASRLVESRDGKILASVAGSFLITQGSRARLDSAHDGALVYDTANGHLYIQVYGGKDLDLQPLGNSVDINGIPFQSIGGVMTIGSKVAGQDATASNQFTTLGQVTSLTSGNVKVLPDANYTVLSSDATLILPEPASARTLTLPAASTMPNKQIKVVCRSLTTGRWILSGSFVQRGTTGATFTENFTNSGLSTGYTYILVSDGTKWYDVND